MYRYLFISILFAFSLSAAAQSQSLSSMGSKFGANTTTSTSKPASDDDEERPVEPKITVIKDMGLSLGVDLAPAFIYAGKKLKDKIAGDEDTDSRNKDWGIAFIGRYGLKNKWWGNAEVGVQHTEFENKNYKYGSNGTFIKIGVDYDIFHSEDFPVNDNIFVGIRYGYAFQSHWADEFTIVDSYWGDYVGDVEKTTVNSHMLEAVFGIRCEMLKNFYMGWSFRCRFLVASAHDNTLDPYSVPGYGSYDSKAGIGFTYTLEYQIPFNKLWKNKDK